AALERRATCVLGAGELAELGPAPRDGGALERQVARVAGTLEAVDGCEQVTQERRHVSDVGGAHALDVVDLRVRQRIEAAARAFGERRDLGEHLVGAIEATGEHELERAATQADELCGLRAWGVLGAKREREQAIDRL